jgi:zinc protease
MKIKAVLLVAFAVIGRADFTEAATTSDYAVVVSQATAQDPGWAKVTAALEKKHHATVVTATNVFSTECRDQLRQLQPRYVAFVAKPDEVGVEFVRQVHLLSRVMDEDPYDDFIWGIITAATPEAALRIAQVEKPLVVHRALTTTGVNAGALNDCLTLSDGKPGDFMLKENGQVTRGNKTNDNVGAYQRFLNYYNSNDIDLLVSSSHSTEANLEMPFTDGSIVISGEHMFMVDKAGLYSFVRAASGNARSGLWFQSPEGAARRAEWAKKTSAPELRHAQNPKVYIAAGNCLMGDVMNTTDSLVIDWLTWQGVDQFVGYTVPTWFGKGGWGTLDLWQSYGSQNNVAEAFFLNNQCIVHKLVTDYPEAAKLSLDQKSLDQLSGEGSGEPTSAVLKLEDILKRTESKQRKDLIGYIYDRDVVAFYGDPKWDARLDPVNAGSPVKWLWTGKPGQRVLEIECLKDFKKEEMPFLLPERMKNAKVTADAGLNTFMNDEFLLISNLDLKAGKTYRLEIGRAENPHTANGANPVTSPQSGGNQKG